MTKPIIKGVEPITEEQRQEHLESQNTLYHKIQELYFGPKFFERGKFYEYLGVKPIKKLFMYPGTKLHTYLTKKFCNKKLTTNYILSDERDLESLKEFNSGTKFNEIIHGGWLYYFGTATLLGKCELSNEMIFFHVLNTAILMVQRYNRARVYNTIDILMEGGDTLDKKPEIIDIKKEDIA
ncbi:hypothetical protein ACFL1H_07015 [Nanoarchaeota archaeon]